MFNGNDLLPQLSMWVSMLVILFASAKERLITIPSSIHCGIDNNTTLDSRPYFQIPLSVTFGDWATIVPAGMISLAANISEKRVGLNLNPNF